MATKSDSSPRYRARGVSAAKEDVHAAVAGMDKGLYPGAFCKIVEDHLGGDPHYCALMHADTAGTKASLAYLYWRETGDLSVFEGIVQDAIVMNTDDLLCVGVTDNILISGTIGRNKHRIPGEVVAALIAGTQKMVEVFGRFGVRLIPTGGETADVGDLVRTLDVGITATTRLRRDEVIDNRHIRPGLAIVGLASFGQAVYEAEYNSGIGSNGLTAARHDVFHKDYARKYPETFDDRTPKDLVYCGRYRVEDRAPELPICVGKAVLSPTRTYAPVVRALLEEMREHVFGMTHCTGGGQVKCRNFGQGIHYLKDSLFDPPPLFRLIQDCSGAEWREMYQVFNMGHRFELYVPTSRVERVIEVARAFGVEARQVGHCEAAPDAGNRVTLRTPYGTFAYE
jgi:phosphoribosylformylglycinamidine cyclo-ligase